MLIPTEWLHEEDLFDEVVSALASMSDDYSIVARSERDSYGHDGHIFITAPDGRHFRISLWEDR